MVIFILYGSAYSSMRGTWLFLPCALIDNGLPCIIIILERKRCVIKEMVCMGCAVLQYGVLYELELDSPE